MPIFGVLDENNYVVDCIIASTKELAEQLTNKICIESTTENSASIGGTWNGTKFIPKKPFSSWILNQTTNTWEPPTPMPAEDFGWIWDEDSVSWQKLLLDHPGLSS